MYMYSLRNMNTRYHKISAAKIGSIGWQTTMETPCTGSSSMDENVFGLSVAPEIFQARLKQAALSGLEGIAIITDNISIYGSGDNDT